MKADYRTPVILAMLGRIEDARDTIIDTLDDLGGRDADAAIEPRLFGERFCDVTRYPANCEYGHLGRYRIGAAFAQSYQL